MMQEGKVNTRIVGVLITFIILSFAQQRDSIVRVGACATPGAADGVFTQGQYTYIADRGGLTSIEISIPSLPSVSYYLNQPRCEALGVYIKDTIAYLNSAGGPSFTLVNISNPSLLVRISYVEVPIWGGAEPKGIYAGDTIAYFADGSAGFLIIDISNLLNPTILCTLNTPGRVSDLCVRDTLAYLADDDSLLIMNISNPYNPVIIGHISIPGSGAYDVWVTGNYAFVTEEDLFGGQGKVNMIDITDPTSPTLVEQISMAATPYGLFVLNDKVYVAADDWWSPGRKKGEGRADIEGGIRIIHWEEPDSMSLLARFDTPGRCRDIFVVDSFIYIAAWDSFMIYKYITTGITENEKKYLEPISSFEVYPNPAIKNVSCELEFRQSCRLNLIVYDKIGRKVRDIHRGSIVAGRTIFIWDGEDEEGKSVAEGTYFIKAKVTEPVFQESEKVIYLGGE